jgi:FAD synthase
MDRLTSMQVFVATADAGSFSEAEVESMPTVGADGERVSSTVVREACARGEAVGVSTLLGRP